MYENCRWRNAVEDFWSFLKQPRARPLRCAEIDIMPSNLMDGYLPWGV